mmetsp:Transcript_92317/g.275399  ORF Transcript_92317/g.275399 Transcript_92317/m.275399 type:complete len:240 (-) Transcript_92317:653-1372(-)
MSSAAITAFPIRVAFLRKASPRVWLSDSLVSPGRFPGFSSQLVGAGRPVVALACVPLCPATTLTTEATVGNSAALTSDTLNSRSSQPTSSPSWMLSMPRSCAKLFFKPSDSCGTPKCFANAPVTFWTSFGSNSSVPAASDCTTASRLLTLSFRQQRRGTRPLPLTYPSSPGLSSCSSPSALYFNISQRFNCTLSSKLGNSTSSKRMCTTRLGMKRTKLTSRSRSPLLNSAKKSGNTVEE